MKQLLIQKIYSCILISEITITFKYLEFTDLKQSKQEDCPEVSVMLKIPEN